MRTVAPTTTTTTTGGPIYKAFTNPKAPEKPVPHGKLGRLKSKRRNTRRSVRAGNDPCATCLYYILSKDMNLLENQWHAGHMIAWPLTSWARYGSRWGKRAVEGVAAN